MLDQGKLLEQSDARCSAIPKMQTPQLGPISTQRFNLYTVQGPTQPNQRLDLHIDLEGSGGLRQTLNGVCAIGVFGVVRNGPVILEYEAAVEALAGRDDPTQIATYWSEPNHQAAWERIVKARRPRIEVATEVTAIVQCLKDLGWQVHVLARPVGYDFRELTGFFESLGVEHLARNGRFRAGDMTPDEILDQAVCGFRLLTLEEQPHDPRGTMASPFGFGGARQVTDINQQMIGFCTMLGLPPIWFNTVMLRVIGRDALAHGGLQDAKDQAHTWYAVLDAVDAYVSALNETSLAAAKDKLIALLGTVKNV